MAKSKSWLDKYSSGGGVKPIVISDPNDPRLKSYQDSLTLFNSTKYDKDRLKKAATYSEWSNYVSNWDKLNPQAQKAGDRLAKLNKEPPQGSIYTRKFNTKEEGDSYTYKKPVQPVVYQPKPNQTQPFEVNGDEVYERPISVNKNKPTYADSLKLYNSGKKQLEEYWGHKYTDKEYNDYPKDFWDNADNIIKTQYKNDIIKPITTVSKSDFPVYAKPTGTPRTKQNINRLNPNTNNSLDNQDQNLQTKVNPYSSKVNIPIDNFTITYGIGANRGQIGFNSQDELDKYANQLRTKYPHNLSSQSSTGKANYDFPSASKEDFKFGTGGTIPDPAIQENKDWLTNWYSNRSSVLPKGEAKNYLYTNLPNILGNIKRANVQRDSTLPDNTLGNTIYSTGTVQLAKDAPPDVLTHELTHISDQNNWINFEGAEPISKSDLPRGSQEREHYKYFSQPDELHANIMAFRKAAGFKPTQIIDDKTIDNFQKTYKPGTNYNVDIILKMTKRKGLINMLNKMTDGDNTQNNWLNRI